MAKEQSLFIEHIDKYMKGIVVRVVEKLNDKQNNELTYLHKQMLRKEFSVSGKWETISTLNTRVSADFVAMDSSLPLKRRDAIMARMLKKRITMCLLSRKPTHVY